MADQLNFGNVQDDDDNYSSFYDDYGDLLLPRAKRSSPSFNNNRVIRETLLDKINTRKEEILTQIFGEKRPIIPRLSTDDRDKDEVLADIKDKIEARNERIKAKHAEFLDKLEDIKAKIRNARSAGAEEFYRYKPLSSYKKWDPEDLLMKGRLNHEKKLLAKRKLKEELPKRRIIRIRRKIDSGENKIAYVPNEIRKEVKGNVYFANINNESLQNQQENVANPAANSTVTKSNEIAKENRIELMWNPEVLSFNDDQIVNNTLYSFDDKNFTFTPRYGTTRENIQKINVNFKPNIFEKIFDKFNEFITDIENKISGYFFM